VERLDSLEALAQTRLLSEPVAAETAERERSLELKRVELEESARRLDAEAERRKGEWSEALAKLEADRRSLADAWERVEQARIDNSGLRRLHPDGPALGRGAQFGSQAISSQAGASAAPRSAAAQSVEVQLPAQAILRQFQTLSSDVRRNSEERRGSRSEGKRPES
jgi:hypothetical protein